MKTIPSGMLALLFGILTCAATAAELPAMSNIPQAAGMPQPFTVASTAFENHGKIPFRYTAYGENISPQIRWSGLPEGTQELALVLDDPFAPTPEPFVHWVVYNIPAVARMLPEGMSSDERISDPCTLCGAINGLNGTGNPGYFGPRPPAGNGVLHAYSFRVYALDRQLDLEPGLGRDALMDAIADHIIGAGRLMGHYEQMEE